MARRKVVVTPMFKYERNPPKTPYLGWGRMAIRKLNTVATSPRLLKFRGCVASELSGKKHNTLKDAQEAFTSAVKACKVRTEV